MTVTGINPYFADYLLILPEVFNLGMEIGVLAIVPIQPREVRASVGSG